MCQPCVNAPLPLQSWQAFLRGRCSQAPCAPHCVQLSLSRTRFATARPAGDTFICVISEQGFVVEAWGAAVCWMPNGAIS
eukprot:3156367-Pleurochrysis_carterae.AAC.1